MTASGLLETRGEAPIAAGTMLPDLLRSRPHLRRVFDDYGLRGCGGAYGPAETVAYFARAHGVELEPLLAELRAAASGGGTVEAACAGPAEDERAASRREHLADTIYRRFFKAGIAVVLTAGAAWGALLLLRIGFAGNFTAVSIHDVNAHGHAQIFGWVGLFVMGFAYQAFPRMRHASLWRPELAVVSFYLMVFGILARAVGEPLFATPALRGLAVAGSVAEVAAIGLFVTVMLATFRRSGKPWAIHDGYIVAAFAFFFVQAVYEVLYLVANTAALSHEALLALVATWQAPLRDLQIHGFALLIILGVAVRMFPALFRLHIPSPRLVRIGLPVLVLAAVGEAGFFVLMRTTGSHWWALPLYACVLVLAGMSIALTLRWGLLARGFEQERSVKFVRAGVVWLQVSMVMLVLAPLYMYALLPALGPASASGRHAVEIGFSHAYYGAVRHAITVGFISLVILGMAAKVVPTLNGVDIRRLRGLWLPFALVNTGCTMRVVFQVATDLREWSYPVAGISGLLEVSGIALWGVHLWRIMNGWQPAAAGEFRVSSFQFRVAGNSKLETANRAASGCSGSDEITGDERVSDILERFPEALPVLIERGFAPLANPLLRRTLARTVTLRTAAALWQVDADELVATLNAAARGTAQAASSGMNGPGRQAVPVAGANGG
ncbi:MAG: DUF1858 domain-containing protein [Planctomycetota bacterium]